MGPSSIMTYAKALYSAHGDKAEFMAAQRSRVAREKGDLKAAETWRKLRAQIRQMRGPLAT